jgi:LmbE family N-acetylglucosaminyl deacetylase
MGIQEPHRKALVICPHFDDACFSVGGLLLKKSFDSVTVLTVFSKSSHAPKSRVFYFASKFADNWGINYVKQWVVEFVSLQRKKEDFKFCRKVGATQSVLDFKDSNLRCLRPFSSFSENEFLKDPTFNQVVYELQKWVISNKFDTILCPLGVGNQVDHLIIFQAVSYIIKKYPELKIKMFFYEDLPYSVKLELSSISELANKRIGASSTLYVDITDLIETKKSLIDIYASQAAKKEQMMRHAKRLSTLADRSRAESPISFYERLWTFA